MSASVISICSNALLRVGADPINAFTDGNGANEIARGRLCENLWPSIRDSLLRSHPWNCAVKREKLAPLSAVPAFNYTKQFQLPADWLRTLDINDVPTNDYDFRMEGGKILVNTDVLNLRYIFRNEEPSSWDALLIECAELQMAAAIAYPLTKSMSLKQELRAEAARLLKQARAVDGQEESQQTFGDSPLLNSRYANIYTGSF
jgi:hypothetical protein